MKTRKKPNKQWKNTTKVCKVTKITKSYVSCRKWRHVMSSAKNVTWYSKYFLLSRKFSSYLVCVPNFGSIVVLYPKKLCVCVGACVRACVCVCVCVCVEIGLKVHTVTCSYCKSFAWNVFSFNFLSNDAINIQTYFNRDFTNFSNDWFKSLIVM